MVAKVITRLAPGVVQVTFGRRHAGFCSVALVALLFSGVQVIAAPVRQPAPFTGPGDVGMAQLVCDARGCGPGSAQSPQSGQNIGRPYLGANAEEQRALAERDRQRKERAGQPGRGQNNGGGR